MGIRASADCSLSGTDAGTGTTDTGGEGATGQDDVVEADYEIVDEGKK